jgi:hypothetical protein
MSAAVLSARVQSTTRWITADPERLLLLLWVVVLGIQLPVGVANFNFSPSDVILALLLALSVFRRRELVGAAIRRVTPLHFALGAIAVALAWGTLVAFARLGFVPREAWLNKDLGYFVLVGIALVIRSQIASEDAARKLLVAAVVGGSIVSWIAAAAAIADNWRSPGTGELRFDGFLLNPSANGIYLAVLIVVQLALTWGAVTAISRYVSYLNALGLTLLLLATVSRSTWITVLVVLLVLAVTLLRSRPVPALALAALLAIFTLQPLAAALSPLIAQIAEGHGFATLRDNKPVGTPPPSLLDIFGTSSDVTGQPARPADVGSSSETNTSAEAGSSAERFLRYAGAAAVDRNGATDRAAIVALALHLWLSSPAVAVSGLGLEVFPQLTPYTSLGVPVIVHTTYVWLPAEMGVAGVVALALFLFGGVWVGREMLRRDPSDVRIAIVGGLLLFAVWILFNEGLNQRPLWLMLALGGALIAPVVGRRTER